MSDARHMQVPERDNRDSPTPPRLLTLGGLTLVSSPLHEPNALLGPGKPVALLLYLHSAPNRSATREHLTDLLWADLEPVAARHALRQTLWYLRQRLGADSLGTDNGDVVLGLELSCDRDEFVTAVGAGRFEHAIGLYQGHFLPDFAVPGGLEFEHWADAERTRLRLMFLRAAESIVRARMSTGHVREARELALRVRDGSPQTESAWRLYLETLIAGHDTVGALAEAERMLTILRQEGRVPEPASRALLRAIQQEPDAAPSTTSGLVAELVGREREFAAIVEAWDSARNGSTVQLHVTAPAGLGKTRLLLDVQARLTAAGGQCVYVRANPGERAVPLAFAAELAAGLATLSGAMGISPASASVLVALNPALSSVYSQSADAAGGDEAMRRRTLALTELIRVVADDAPLAILVDDLHWVDRASRQVLDAVLGRLTVERLLTVSAARPVPGADPSGQAVRMQLPPLTLDQMSALLASLGALPDDLSVALPQLVLEASAGSPLLALESLQATLDAGLLELRDGIWRSTDHQALRERLTRGSAVRDRVAQLERKQSWLLLLLGTAGLPVSTETLRAATGRAPDGVLADLNDLERRGFVQRTADGWEPAHDTIADAAAGAAPTEARLAASSALGRALVREHDPPHQLVARAAQLLAESDEAALQELFRRWVRRRRRAGDRRRPSALAAALLGGTDAHRTLDLARSLPLTDRLAVGPQALGLAAGLLLIVGAFALGSLTRNRAQPDVTLLVAGKAADGRRAAFGIPLAETAWDPSVPLEATYRERETSVADAGDWYANAGTPDGKRWARSVASDSGSVDVVLRDATGRETWLITGPADDNFEDWSPDGRFVVVTTGRWHPQSMYDVATVDVAMKEIRQLTHGDGHDISPRWSPDGSRIALIRRFPLSGDADEVCWVTADGSAQQCRSLAAAKLMGLSWTTPDDLIVLYEDQEESHALKLNLTTGATEPLALTGPNISFGPNGRWAICRCLPPGALHPGWYAVPTDRPERLRLITWDGSPDAPMRFYWMPAPRRNYLDRLAVDSFPEGVPVGSIVRPTAIGWDAEGRRARMPFLSWTVSDSAVAQIGPDGTLHALSAGVVILTASAGGWRTARGPLRIHADTALTVMREGWTEPIEPRWRSYGVPRPMVAEDAGHPVLFVNGDSSHLSGVYSSAFLPSRAGVGVEALLQTPVTNGQWQTISIELTMPESDSTLAAWDHVTGRQPGLGTPERTCAASVNPNGLVNGRLEMGFIAAGTQRTVPIPWLPADRRWYRIRVQVLPDGRCGFALDGKPLWVSRAHLVLYRPFVVNLKGQTVRTRLLVGPLEAWHGVRMDVDWGAVE